MNPTRIGVAVASWFVLCAEPGHAEILLPGARLEVRSGGSIERCVAEGELSAKIRAQLSTLVEWSGSEPRTIAVNISGAPEALVAEVRVIGPTQGVRRIRARQCAGLTDALAVTIALILDPNANTAAINAADVDSVGADPASRRQERQAINAGESSLQDQAVPSSAPSTSEGTATPRMAARGESPARHLEWRAWAGVGVGSWEPWQVEAGVALFSNAWGFELGGFYQPAHEHAVGNGNVRLAALGGLAAGCFQSGSKWRGMLCLRGLAGAESARGIGFDRDDTSLLTTVSLGPSVGVEHGSRLIWGLYLSGQVVVFRDNYVIENDTSALEAPPVAAWLFARVSLSNRPSGS